MKINMLFLSWRDIKHPLMGGAEVFTHEMFKQLDHDQYDITHISPMSQKRNGEMNLEDEVIDGIRYIRYGNMLTVILYAILYYYHNHKQIDYVVDQCNTHRFFTPFWVKKTKRVLFIHQMTKEIWLTNLKFPFGAIGKLLESYMTKLYRNNLTLTVSKSTKDDLIELGFKEELVKILPEGINFMPWSEDAFESKDEIIFTYVGRFSSYKGINTALEAFCRLYHIVNSAKFYVVGKENKTYIEQVLEPIRDKYNVPKENIVYFGFVSEEEKLHIMSKSRCLVFPSQREGWGLTITEAAAVGTPSIVYNSPGLRDAVDNGKTGYMTAENSKYSIFELMKESVLNPEEYQQIKASAYEFSKQFNWVNTAHQFQELIHAS